MSENKIEDALTSFREQWQRELDMSPRPDTSKALPSKVEINVDYEDDTIEEKVELSLLRAYKINPM